MYKTGDLARWRPDGNIEFLGRNDGQIKIRGYRVELEEIESHLGLHVSVQQAVVVARQDPAGAHRLVAYLTLNHSARTQGTPSVEQFRDYVKTKLPDHCVPHAFVVLDQLPTTPNGKLDRSALPAPNSYAFSSKPYQAPDGVLERTLAELWCSLLDIERVGREDNFFELGGHSLLAMRLISAIRERLRIELPIAALFDEPTLRALAVRVATEGELRSTRRATRAGHLRHLIDEMDDAAVAARIGELERTLGYQVADGVARQWRNSLGGGSA
jgi:acyl carrier protein